MEQGLMIFLVIAAAIVISVIVSVYSKRKKLRELKDKIAYSWGKTPKQKYKEADFDRIKGYHLNRKENIEDRNVIDDITWNDIDMDNIFKRMNSTQSSIGEEYFYDLLRRPVFDQNILNEREKLIELFSNNKGLREKLQLFLGKVGKTDASNVSNYFFKNSKYKGKAFIFKILSAAAFIAPFLCFINVGMGVTLTLGMFILNMIIHFGVKNNIGWQLEVLAYIINMVSKAKKLADENLPELKEYNEVLKNNLKDIYIITRKAFFLFTINNTDLLTEYIRIVFLREAIEYETVMSTIKNYSDNFLKIYEIFGLLDSIISIASYRKSLQYYTIPELYSESESKKKRLSFTDLCHPLIDEPVPNSIAIDKSVLLTGSNASGKSTFLKTVAINAIFAQTINTCLAKEYKADFFMVFSSMALKDNLLGNESYFVVETKSLKRILDYLNEEISCLCFVDEVLRGTNTIERVAASSQILYHLSESNCLCFAATHDIELSYILIDHYSNYHFQERIEEGNILFDYKLYEGRSNTRNAIKLLSLIGYNEGVVKSAESMANHFLSEGKWKAANQ